MTTNNNPGVSGFSHLFPPTLEAPVVEGVHGEIVDVKFLDKGMRVFIPKLWNNSAEFGWSDFITFVLEFDGAAPFKLTPKELKGPVDISEPLIILPSFIQKNGLLRLYYEVRVVDPNTTSYEYSDTKTMKLDLIPPGGNSRLSAPESVLDPITNLDLATRATIPIRVLGDYPFRDKNDTVSLSMSCANTPLIGAPVHTQKFASDVGEMILDVPVEEFRKLSACLVIQLSYTVTDQSNNTSINSSLVGTANLLTDQPSGLLAPVIPAQSKYGLIHRAAAREGVFFTINYNKHKPTDQCVYRWGKYTSPVFTVTSVPFRVDVSWRVLIYNGADSVKLDNLPVTYTVFRDNETIASGITSPPTLINENQIAPGVENPEAPALVNKLLSLVDIFGGASNKANEIDSSDINKNLRASYTLHKDPKVGEVISLSLSSNSGVVATYTVKPGDREGQVVDFPPITWLAFMGGGTTPSTSAHYVIDNGVNQHQSLDRLLIVMLVPPARLPRPIFVHAAQHPNRMLTCATTPKLWDGIHILFDPGSYVPPVDSWIIIIWQGFLNYPDRNPLPEVYEEFRVRWEGNSTQLFVLKNYEKLIRRLNDFSGGKVIGRIVHNGIVVAEFVPAYVQLDRKYAGSGNFCGRNGIGPGEK